MDGDEVITIVCRYPPPIVPKPFFNPLINIPEKGPLPAKAPLAGTHILMIICAILFLTLLSSGLRSVLPLPEKTRLTSSQEMIDDSSASIVSRESIQSPKNCETEVAVGGAHFSQVRRFSNGVRGPGDELSVGLQQDGATTWLRSRDRGGRGKHKAGLSGEAWRRPMSSSRQVKIPRAHPVYPVAAEAESASVASDTIPSDYPSETPSEAEHAHTNQAFMIDESYQSEGYGETRETSAANARMHAAAPPAFDVRVRVQRPPAPPSPPSTITATETDGGSIRQMTLLEEHERQESVRTVSPAALPLPARQAHLPPPARPPRPAALYSQVSRERQSPLTGGPHLTGSHSTGLQPYGALSHGAAAKWGPIPRGLNIARPPPHGVPLHGAPALWGLKPRGRRQMGPDPTGPQHHEAPTSRGPQSQIKKMEEEWSRRPRSIVSLNTEMTDTHSVTEVTDRSHARMFHIKKPPPPPVMSERLETEEHELLLESLEPIPETPILPARKPEITSHVVDDVFLRTITEKKTIEDIERHKRLVTEYKQASNNRCIVN
ncbi:hypothetical protein MSG28_000131 [Choristoneura fumiferana]|uniref:Uncharacterized protein n=1 Tax=Choristoneura fumiferana TaxID=7141 RepID=A0ACC0JZN3_CHOFU|nr:hypothetical protein MSG28_000131 [Choristoneura fumiferana]